jgi:hypothetical protein
MTTSPDYEGGGIITVTPTVQAVVSVNGEPLSTVLNGRLIRVEVDNHVNLPGMFELTFLDYDCTTLSLGGIQMGSIVTIAGQDVAPLPAIGTLSALTAAPLITGEVTALEGLLDGQRRLTVVRGYTQAHRLQRARKSQTFIGMTDSDIAVQIATAAGLTPGTIDPTTTVHSYLAQVNQTDWEFLRSRALEIGYDTGVSNGQFYFRSAATPASTEPVTIAFPETLFSFRPRVSSGNLTPDVEVRVWDPMQMQAFAASANVASGGTISPATLGAQFEEGAAAGTLASGAGSPLAGLSGDMAEAADDINTAGGAAADMASAADALSGMGSATDALSGMGSATDALSGMGSAADALSDAVPGLQGLAGAAALGSPVGDLGPPPSPTAHIITDRPVGTAQTMATSGQASATALSSDLSGTFAEAEGETFGNPAIQPGTMLLIEGTQYPFGGEWMVSHVRHVFDDTEFGYRTCFAAHGRQDRSMLGLTSGGSATRRQGPATDGVLGGVVCGVVSNVFDELGRGRVKVTLPWLSPTFETDWAPVAQPCVGPNSGTLFLPSVGDEVLVAFEQGDPRRPYVVGSFINNYTAFTLMAGGPAATLEGLAGGLGGIAGQIASTAGALESVAGDIASLTVAGQLIEASGMAPPDLSGSPSDLFSNSVSAANDLGGLAADALGADAAMTGPGMLLSAGGINVQGDTTSTAESMMGSSESALGLPGGSQSAPGMSGIGTGAGGIGGAGLTPGLGAVQQSPGMVGEVVRRGFVSDTGNVLVFNDQSIPGAGAAGPGAGASSMGAASPMGAFGSSLDGDASDLGSLDGDASDLGAGLGPPGGGLGTMGPALSETSQLGGAMTGEAGGGMAGAGGAAGGQAIASSITLGSQNGNHGVYVDQVASMVIVQANAVPGVSMSPMPMLVISAGGLAGAAEGAAGAAGSAGGASSTGGAGGSGGMPGLGSTASSSEMPGAGSSATSTSMPGAGGSGGMAGAGGAAGEGGASAATGSIIITAGMDVTIAAEGTLTLMAPAVMIAGETIKVAGELIPLTQG